MMVITFLGPFSIGLLGYLILAMPALLSCAFIWARKRKTQKAWPEAGLLFAGFIPWVAQLLIMPMFSGKVNPNSPLVLFCYSALAFNLPYAIYLIFSKPKLRRWSIPICLLNCMWSFSAAFLGAMTLTNTWI